MFDEHIPMNQLEPVFFAGLGLRFLFGLSVLHLGPE